MKSFCSILFFLIEISLFGQDIAQKGKTIGDFVPTNWKILKQAEGDLNKDKKNDFVLIIENTDSANILQNENLGSTFLNTNPRYLLILFKNIGSIYSIYLISSSTYVQQTQKRNHFFHPYEV